MIAFLKGILHSALPTRAVIDVNGVGYQVEIPLSSFDKLPSPGAEVRLLTHLAIREDAQVLYGFITEAERDLFQLLVQHVSGVGPKLALAVLSGMPVAVFKAAVVNADIVAISKISGLGKKTAERIVLELKDKVGVAAAWEAASTTKCPDPTSSAMNDAVLALISLGYKQVDAQKAVRKVLEQSTSPVADDLVRSALRILVGS